IPPAEEERSNQEQRTGDRAAAGDGREVHPTTVATKSSRVGNGFAPNLRRGVTRVAPATYTECVSEVANAQDFSSIAEAHLDDVYRYLLYVTANPSTAEDLTSETCERALRRWSSFDPRRGSAQTWLCQLARGAALDHFRAEERRRRREERLAEPDRVAEHEIPDEYGPGLRQARRTLAGGGRGGVGVRIVLELDVKTAARVLNISPSACTTRLNRALERLEQK